VPNREDEYYSNQRDSLRYCSKHKHYYDAQFGCQLCWLENHAIQESPPLQKCPECSETSLYHNEVTNIYECVNLECKKTYTEEELEETKSRIEQSVNNQNAEQELKSLGEQSANHRNTKEDSESITTEHFTKCPVCLFDTLEWIPELNLYECQYDKCHGRTFSKEELEEIRRIREEPTKGKSWFGNEYWDAKKKRWRKP
jgi:hypothetical protein